MSNTTMTDQLTGLPPAVIHVYTQLVAFTDPAPVDDIAQAAETARSSTFKALVSLERRGLAHRERGIQNGPSRRPDLWRATHTDPGPTPDETPTRKKPGLPTSDAAPADTPGADPTDLMPQPDECTAHTPDSRAEDTGLGQSVSREPLPAQATGPNKTADLPADSPAGTERLAPGGLRRLVIDHLNAHPGEAFTATKISRTIDRSSGAIANALVTLARQGLAERVTDRPRTYRAVAQEPTA